jgi:6-phosphogluconolactonase/glucosamine-6-phosphate isomerase/deaminase
VKNNIFFRKITSAEPVVDYLSNRIGQKLVRNLNVLWLVPGGSAIKVAAAISVRLPKAHLKNLTVTLTDERYGPVGHKDSNWPQLEAAGFKLEGATMQPVLADLSLEETENSYSKVLEEDLKKADFSIALAGMGPDGHIFGIKPKSPALKSDKAVVGYKWDDFVRLTPTANFISQLDEVVIYAVGEEKWPQLEALDKDLPASEQLAQILKKLKKVTIFNDYRSS